MTVLALKEGGTAIWSAIPVAESEMSRIEALGPVRFLLVPNAGHRLDLKPWSDRYPTAKIIAPPSSREAVSKATPVNATADIINHPQISIGLVSGTKADEFFLTVRRNDGVALILNDILSNVRHPKGVGANIMAHLFGFGVSRPRTSVPVRRMFVKDAEVVANQFRTWAALPDLRRVIVSHGEAIEQNLRQALERAAADF